MLVFMIRCYASDTISRIVYPLVPLFAYGNKGDQVFIQGMTICNVYVNSVSGENIDLDSDR